jgi:DNA polymerase-3 subunit epsilon
MRQIVLDTETTGLEPSQGDRVIEVAAVELVNLLPTGVSFHRLVDPGRDIPAEATRVHGQLTPTWLAADIAGTRRTCSISATRRSRAQRPSTSASRYGAVRAGLPRLDRAHGGRLAAKQRYPACPTARCAVLSVGESITDASSNNAVLIARRWRGLSELAAAAPGLNSPHR